MQFLQMLTWWINFRCATLPFFVKNCNIFRLLSCFCVAWLYTSFIITFFMFFSNLFCKNYEKYSFFFSFCVGPVSVRISTAIPAKADLVDQFLRRNTAIFLEKAANFSDFCHAFVWPGYTLLS